MTLCLCPPSWVGAEILGPPSFPGAIEGVSNWTGGSVVAGSVSVSGTGSGRLT